MHKLEGERVFYSRLCEERLSRLNIKVLIQWKVKAGFFHLKEDDLIINCPNWKLLANDFRMTGKPGLFHSSPNAFTLPL